MFAVCFGFIFNTRAQPLRGIFNSHLAATPRPARPVVISAPKLSPTLGSWSARSDTEINCVDRVAGRRMREQVCVTKMLTLAKPATRQPRSGTAEPQKWQTQTHLPGHSPSAIRHQQSARYSVSASTIRRCMRGCVFECECGAGTWRDLFICLCEWPVCGCLCLDLAVWTEATIKLKKNLYMHMNRIKRDSAGSDDGLGR